MLQPGLCDEINVYCSSEEIVPFLPEGVKFLKRPQELDLPTSNFSQIFTSFIKEKDAVFMFMHMHWAPFITTETMIDVLNQ